MTLRFCIVWISDDEDVDEIKLDSDDENNDEKPSEKSPFFEAFEPAAETDILSEEDEKPSADTPKLTVTQTVTSTSKASAATVAAKDEVSLSTT